MSETAGSVLAILAQSRRDRHAATRFFRKLLKGQGREPRRLITDKLRSYAAAHRTVMPSVMHSTQQYENNRAEVSHQPTRQRERQMRRFTSAAQAQRFLSVHGVVLNLFRVGRQGRPRAVIRFKISQPRTTSLPCPSELRARRPRRLECHPSRRRVSTAAGISPGINPQKDIDAPPRRCCMIQLRREWGRFSNFSFRTPQRRISAYPARPSG